MASASAAASSTMSTTRSPLSLTPPSKITKDIPGPDNPIPLSPQWLLPKPGDSKAGAILEEIHQNPSVDQGGRPHARKSPGNGDEILENQKKKDVFRPTFLDMESGRRDRWTDEERGANLSLRKDRWSEGDKESGDNRKTDRWVDSAPARHFGEARRTPSDRWEDPGKDNADHDQRRESKWNSRWGPGEKLVDKWTNASKHCDMPTDKWLAHSSNPGKDEKEGDSYRPWRPRSLQGRGRADPPPHNSHMTGKEVPGFNHGKGHEDNDPLTLSAGRGRVTFGMKSVTKIPNHPQSFGFMPHRGDNGLGDREPSPFMYSRTKLLDIFRQIDLGSSNKTLEVLTRVPSLTLEEPSEPVALCVPTPEESAILKGIDKGDIVSSGAPQVSKDGSAGRSSLDFAMSRQRKLGNSDDVSSVPGDAVDKDGSKKGAYSSISEHLPPEKQTYSYGSTVKYSAEAVQDDPATIKREDEVSNNRDASSRERASLTNSPWRPAPTTGSPRDCLNVPYDSHSRSSAMSWSRELKDRPNVLAPDSSHASNELNWEGGENSTVGKSFSSVIYTDVTSRNPLQPSPEDLMLYYKDPQGLIQGPFPGSDIIGWFEAGYFGIDLQVRLASSPNNSSFLLLGDVMPHLRAKARPPPGFNTAMQTDAIDVPNKLSSSGFGNATTGGVDLIRNDHRHVHGTSIEAENRYLESLMSGEIRSSPLERFSKGMPSAGAESGDVLNLLSRTMNLERPESLSNPYPYWPPRDAANVVPSPSINRDSNMPQTDPLPSIADIPGQSLAPNVEIMPALQGLSDRSSTVVNNRLGGWSTPHAGNESFKDKIEVSHGHNFPQAVFGMQHQLQPQNQPLVANLLGQTEKFLGSGQVQNPHLLNLLQQQYLLQLQSQQSVPGPQLSLQDQILLLQHRQKQEEQQKLLQQQFLQQQQLLSKSLLEQQLVQRLGDPSFRQQVSAPIDGNATTDSSTPQLLNHLLQVNCQAPISSMLDDNNVAAANLPPRDSQDLSHTAPSDDSSSLLLPHQMLGGLPKGLSSMAALDNNSELNNSSPGSVMLESNLITTGRSLSEEFVVSADHKLSTKGGENELLKPEVTNDTFEETPVEVCNVEVSELKSTKNVEAGEVKKTFEKKSRKQKSSKAQSSTEQLKAISKGSNVQLSKQSVGGKVSSVDQSEVAVASAAASNRATVHQGGEVISSQDALCVSADSRSGASESDAKFDQSSQGTSAQRAWKPAVSVKPKSFLEIQQEEQQRVQMETPAPNVSISVSSVSLSAPWAGVAGYTESKVKENHTDNTNVKHNTGLWESLKKKSGLHDLLAGEVLAKSSEINMEISDVASSLPPKPTMSKQLDDTGDANFIEAKDTKKSRRKAAKAKGVTSKAPSADLTVASSPVEKGKSFKPVQAEKEVLPAPPSGPSLGDFVPWKGEPISPSPSPAWLSEPAKFPKPTSLRDILREQDNKVTHVHSQISTPQKPQSTQTRGGPLSVLALSPSKGVAPVLTPETSSQSNFKGDDDLFWGPPEHSKQETKQVDFGGWSTKSTPGVSSRQKSAGGKTLQSVSTQIPTKGRRDGSTKHSDAADFRDWCESESVRLTGSRDTSFLEFCSKQTKSEAETLLKENLGSFDPNHEFVEKFLNYMEFLPADVIEIAFQTRNDLKAYNKGARDPIPEYNDGIVDVDRDSKGNTEGSAKGGKKKGKKGKKVSPSILGFNVVSNRIMMGEIQTLDD